MSKGVIVTMSELVDTLGDERVNARFVRFLVAEGVIAAPRGGRANADYGDDHAAGIRRYLQLRDLGLSAARTKEVVGGTAGGGVPVPLGPGLMLIIDQEKLADSLCIQTIVARIREALDLIRSQEPIETQAPTKTEAQ